jgi:hypothetical protein
MIPPQ